MYIHVHERVWGVRLGLSGQPSSISRLTQDVGRIRNGLYPSDPDILQRCSSGCEDMP